MVDGREFGSQFDGVDVVAEKGHSDRLAETIERIQVGECAPGDSHSAESGVDLASIGRRDTVHHVA